MAAIARAWGLLLLLLLLPWLAHGSSIKSVPELESRMYASLAGFPCVRWLNLTGELGCANPGHGAVSAPILRMGDALDSPATVLVPAESFEEFVDRFGDDKNVVGVLVENGSQAPGFGASDDARFPQAEFAPYENQSWVWNPFGSGMMHRRLNFPVFFLSSPENIELARRLASQNVEKGSKRPANVVEFNDVMQTTKTGTPTTESCLGELSCLPLGGYSVMSTFPPVNVSHPTVKPVVLAMASVDSATFFRDVAPGADSPMSGVIALLAAVDALSHVPDFDSFLKRLVFLVFTGEARGYLGSRQFLAQLKKGAFADYGLTSIHQILEVGSVGQASEATFFVHKQATAAAVDTQQIIDALYLSASSTDSTVKLANEDNPGIPPSSLMTFVHNDPTVAGVVIEEFDTAFTNKYYNSVDDNSSNVNLPSLVVAASLVARSLVLLASDNNLRFDSPIFESIQVNMSLVEEMVNCFFGTSPGMRCSLVESLMTASHDVANHYVGVFQADPSVSPNSMPEVIDDTTRFVWNFLADRTALPREDLHEKCTLVCKNPDEVCVGATQSQLGQCRVSSTRYVPAYSPRLKFHDYWWQLLPLEAGDKMGAADPVYTESFWNSISIRSYQKEDSWYEELILFIGVFVTFVSILSITCSTSLLRKRLKRA
ncbi:nicastrin isoform X1 [Physcomitrium patens]|uniref:Nicastrin n=1 Tax=Physcomitrium patens TaxID=3218 RepID=A9S8V6_PHYPA|nr:nicastrin-like isoform X1 [Physcomitrium patens]PNR27703.1 hypothetical protein PHYPA_029855 [Physcomitrium patens]|eukprot:XP_024365272.1 nicastrin-like isoform X1 [Physcomitrella patens]